MHQPSLIILIDSDPDYLSALTVRLEIAFPESCMAFNQIASAWNYLSAIRRAVLILCDPHSLLALNRQISDATDVNANWRRRHFATESWTVRLSRDTDRPYRLMPFSQLIGWLNNRLLEAPFNLNQDSRGYLLAVNMGWAGHEFWIRRHIQMVIGEGREVFYLPLMPAYRMTLINKPGHGLTLTALLLKQRNGDPPAAAEIGHYLEPHPDGYWQFRPPDSPDDLIDAPVAELRSIVDRIREKSPESLLIVDCQALGLKKIAALAVSAQQVAARFVTPACWSEQIAQQELATLLNKLPNSCRIVEMHDEPNAT